jgi:penicillin-binding protein 1B
VKTSFVKNIRDQKGQVIFDAKPDRKPALDPRVAYLVENTLEEVLRSGTGAGVHARGFNLPGAGKTGTSRDGWFAGFTSKLICVVWVGFDDNRDFKLEGARSALPIWAEFMKRAHQHREYRNVHRFEAPDGIVTAEIDESNGMLATPACPKVRSQVFLSGTQPVEVCRFHGGARTQVAGWEPSAATPAPTTVSDRPPTLAPAPQTNGPKTARSIPVAPAPPPEPQQEKKPHKGFFGRLRDVFK